MQNEAKAKPSLPSMQTITQEQPPPSIWGLVNYGLSEHTGSGHQAAGSKQGN
jgi:hypothetical protein